MTTHFHRGRNENLIVQIIKVIPGTSKKKSGAGGGGRKRGGIERRVNDSV